MKRTIFVLALVLTLLVAPCGEVFSRSVPWGYSDPGSGGDDHTWGGDFQAGADGPGGNSHQVSGGWIPADMIITTILFKWLGMNIIGDKTTVDADYFIENQVKFVEPNEPVPTNTGGNQ